jgi:hypothetical protein
LFAIGESWDWKEKEKYGRRESAERAYINFCRRIHRQNYSVCDSVGYSDGKQGTTVWKFLFESLGDSVGMLNGESDTSPYGAVVLNPSVIPSVKSPAKTSTSMNNLFFILNILSVILSVNTGGMTDVKKSVSKCDLKLPTELGRR